MTAQEWLSVLNTLGFPIVAIYAYIKGYVVSPRELIALQKNYDDIKTSHARLETEVKHERDELRKELAETRAILFRVLMGEHGAPGAVIVPKQGGD